MWYKERSAQLRDFVQFGRMLIRSGDIDPQFPILGNIYTKLRLDRNDALWYTCVYLVYYHLGSAITAWRRYPSPNIIKEDDWSRDLIYYKQRRCFRGNDGGRYQLNTLLEVSDGDLYAWVKSLVGGGGEEGWKNLRQAVSELPYHGPWSSYKFCDMMKFVHGFSITAPDIGTKPGDTAGPIAGLCSLTGLDRKQCTEDSQLHRDLLQHIQDEGVSVNGLDQLESLLCDWQSLIQGRYYVGHDIDRDIGQLRNIKNDMREELIKARRNIFDTRLLGEFHSNYWSNIRPELNGVYRSRRRLVNNFSDLKLVKIIDHAHKA